MKDWFPIRLGFLPTEERSGLPGISTVESCAHCDSELYLGEWCVAVRAVGFFCDQVCLAWHRRQGEDSGDTPAPAAQPELWS